MTAVPLKSGTMSDAQPFVYEVRQDFMDRGVLPKGNRMYAKREDAFEYACTLASQMSDKVCKDISGSQKRYCNKDIPFRYNSKACVYFIKNDERHVLYIKCHQLY